MSIFTKDQKVSDTMMNAIQSSLDTKIVEGIHDVQIPGYGIVSFERAAKEAHGSSQLAHEHTVAGNHMHAAIQHERAAMFHRAIQTHLAKANAHMAESKVHADKASTLIAAANNTVATEEYKEPDVSRVADKYKRNQARQMKKRDYEKKEKREDKFK